MPQFDALLKRLCNLTEEEINKSIAWDSVDFKKPFGVEKHESYSEYICKSLIEPNNSLIYNNNKMFDNF